MSSFSLFTMKMNLSLMKIVSTISKLIMTVKIQYLKNLKFRNGPKPDNILSIKSLSSISSLLFNKILNWLIKILTKILMLIYSLKKPSPSQISIRIIIENNIPFKIFLIFFLKKNKK
jgi:hypothetical protein